jgi:hypothetical protein
VRLWLPEDERDAPVVICSELPTNEGSSITYAVEQLAAEVIRTTSACLTARVDRALPQGGNGQRLRDAWAGCVLKLSSHRESAVLGEARLTTGEPTWKSLDHKSVETLMGQAV